jgi:hypothetical protein
MASDIARLGRAGVAGLPGSKSQAQIFLRQHFQLVEPLRGSTPPAISLAKPSSAERANESARCVQSKESATCVRNKDFAAGPAGDVPPAASSPLETAAAPGRDFRGALTLPSPRSGREIAGVQNKKSGAPSPYPLPGQGEGLQASPRAALELFQMPQWARETADARAAVLDALAHFAAAANTATATSPLILARFAESWNAGHITTNCDAHSLIPQVSAPTILRWHRLRARWPRRTRAQIWQSPRQRHPRDESRRARIAPRHDRALRQTSARPARRRSDRRVFHLSARLRCRRALSSGRGGDSSPREAV